MSTVTPMKLIGLRAAPALADLCRLDIDEFERIADLLKAERVELIDGLIVERDVMDPPHELSSEKLRRRLDRLIPEGWFVENDKPLRVHRTYEPLPDLAIVRGDPETDYQDRHPTPADVALLIEIADATLAKDRGEKRVNYAKGGIGVYWIVNLVDRQVEVYTLRRRGGYGKARVFKSGQSVPVSIDGTEVGQIVVDDILPRIAPPAKRNGA